MPVQIATSTVTLVVDAYAIYFADFLFLAVTDLPVAFLPFAFGADAVPLSPPAVDPAAALAFLARLRTWYGRKSDKKRFRLIGLNIPVWRRRVPIEKVKRDVSLKDNYATVPSAPRLTQALHSVLGPNGPRRHSGVSFAPQPRHACAGGSATHASRCGMSLPLPPSKSSLRVRKSFSSTVDIASGDMTGKRPDVHS
jgi:hypothetical protein